MQQQTGEPAVPAAEAIDDFGDLYPRRVGLDRYRVLSLSDEGFQAYEVTLDEMGCTCGDYRYDRDGPDICKHLAVTLYQQPGLEGIEEAVLQEIADDMGALREEVSHAVQRSAEAKAEAAGTEPASSSPEPEPEADAWDGDPGEAFRSLLIDAGLDPDNYEWWVSDEYGSLQVTEDGYLDDDEFSAWVDFTEDLGLEYHGGEDVNYLPPDRFPEVFG